MAWPATMLVAGEEVQPSQLLPDLQVPQLFHHLAHCRGEALVSFIVKWLNWLFIFFFKLIYIFLVLNLLFVCIYECTCALVNLFLYYLDFQKMSTSWAGRAEVEQQSAAKSALEILLYVDVSEEEKDLLIPTIEAIVT